MLRGRLFSRKDAMKSLRQVQEEERELARQRARARHHTPEGRRMREGSSGQRVIYCPQCRSPVVDSDAGKLAHCQRKPECCAILGKI